MQALASGLQLSPATGPLGLVGAARPRVLQQTIKDVSELPLEKSADGTLAMRVHDRFRCRSEVSMQMGNAAERIVARDPDFAAFLTGNRAAIQILAGPATGMEYEVDQLRVTIGRGPGVDLAFDDPAMSRVHACVELGPDGYVLRDLGSKTGTIVNEARIQTALLKDGDCFRVGSHLFAFSVEERSIDLEPFELFPD